MGANALAAARRHKRAGRITEIPQHFLWDWGAKSQKLTFLAYRCLGIECAGKWQGLLMVKLAGQVAKLDPDKGKNLIYIDYLESSSLESRHDGGHTPLWRHRTGAHANGSSAKLR